ncbi:hypothetical protein CL614_01510 [archaeon]|nr:hypothetical protein [archaeon]|tara:strand:+ start:326 stop:694 length:369 start_codon:yes stop_codon:yes gene_type:complete
MKGYLYTIEVMIVVAVIIMSVTYLFRYPISPLNNDEDLVRRYGMDALEFLSMDDIRYLIYNDIDLLNNKIDTILPDTIESTACVQCSLELPKDSVVVVNYYVAGSNVYEPKTLKLYLWRNAI